MDGDERNMQAVIDNQKRKGRASLAASSGSLDRLVMPLERWKALMANDDLGLTTEEIAAGWHFCWEWDGLIIGPGMKELECCKCKAA